MYSGSCIAGPSCVRACYSLWHGRRSRLFGGAYGLFVHGVFHYRFCAGSQGISGGGCLLSVFKNRDRNEWNSVCSMGADFCCRHVAAVPGRKIIPCGYPVNACPCGADGLRPLRYSQNRKSDGGQGWKKNCGSRKRKRFWNGMS